MDAAIKHVLNSIPNFDFIVGSYCINDLKDVWFNFVDDVVKEVLNLFCSQTLFALLVHVAFEYPMANGFTDNNSIPNSRNWIFIGHNLTYSYEKNFQPNIKKWKQKIYVF